MNDITDSQRIQLFNETFESYNLIMGQFPQYSRIHISVDHPEEYAVLIVQAMLLRKYYTETDNVCLGEVINSLSTLTEDTAPKEFQATIKGLSEATQKYGQLYGIDFVNSATEHLGVTDLMYNIIYGETLHGDQERLKKISLWPIASRCDALNMSNSARLRGVKLVNQQIAIAMEKGYLSLSIVRA